MASIGNKLICIICLKRFDSENKENIPAPNFDATAPTKIQHQEEKESTCQSNGRTNLYERFLRFVSQYFKLRNFTGRFIACAKEAKSEDGGPAKLETFCESCGELVKEICDLYKQLRTAQLFLVWKLGQVGQLMKKGMVPGPRSQRSTKLAGGQTTVVMMKQMNVDAARPVAAFRKALQLKCISATKKIMPDVVIPKGLFPDQWKFTYYSTKQTLIRLITVFLLASSQIIKSNQTQPSIFRNCEEQVEQLGNRRPCRKSRKRVKFSPSPIIVKSELVVKDDNASIREEVDCENTANFGNESDSEWSQGAASPMSMDSNASLSRTRTKVNLRSRRNVVVRAEEDGDKDSRNSEDEDSQKPKKRIRRQHIPESEKTVKCPHCPKLVVDQRGLARHLQMVHRSYIPCFCKKCGMRCRNQVEQLRHYREMHKGRKKGSPRSAPIPSNAKRAGVSRRRRVPTQTTRKPAGDGSRSRAILSPCPKCSQMFSKKNLKRHITKVHKLGTAKYECPYCFQLLVGENRFKAHMLCHENKPVNELKHWYCQVCGQHNYTEDSLKVHMNESHQDTYLCTICNEKLATGKLLREHLLLSHETDEKHFHCNICRKIFSTKQFYDIHRILAHKDKRKFVCDFEKCYQIFDTILEMSEHLKTHLVNLKQEENDDENVEKFRCENCEEEFLKKYSLTLHQLLHTSESNTGNGYDCPKCNNNKNCKESLIIHYKFVHGDEEREKKTKRYQCNICEKRFSKKASFSTHVRLHGVSLLDGNFVCEICDVRCVDSIALSVHLQGHYQDEHPFKKDEKEDHKMVLIEGLSKMKKGLANQMPRIIKMDRRSDPALLPPPGKNGNENSFTCDEPDCGKVFKKKDRLTSHKKYVHSSKDWICDMCGSAFSMEYYLKKHMNTHEEPKFTCDECGLMLKSKTCLDGHMKNKHDSNRTANSICSTCGKSFFTKGGLRVHFESTHKPESEWRLKCPSCPRRFYRKVFLDLHLKKCDGRRDEEVKAEKNIEGIGIGGGGGLESTSGGLPRRSARERKKKRNWSDDEEEMTDKRTTEHLVEKDKHEIKSSSLSALSQQGHQNEFQDLLRLPFQQSLVSHCQLPQDPQKLWPGGNSVATRTDIPQSGRQHALTTLPLPQYPQMQFHQPIVNHEFVHHQ